MSVDALRDAARDAGSTCPIALDVPAALRAGGVDKPVESGQVDAEVSDTETPAQDPVAAQREGASALDAAAGVSVECRYQVDGSELSVWVVATKTSGAVNILGPQIASTAELSTEELVKFLNAAPAPGDTTLTPGDGVAVSHLRVDGDGDATMLVSADPVDDLSGETLRTVAEKLADQAS